MLTDWWVSEWTRSAHDVPDAVSVLVYLGLVLAFTSLVFLRTIAFTLAMLHAGTNLHNSMFSKVLHAKMSFFW